MESKSNEIDALVPLLERMDTTASVVSIDAMGCQTDVAQQIITQHGYYLLALKGNQESLLEEVACAFQANRGRMADEAWEYSRGRFEERRCRLLSTRACPDESVVTQWPGLQSVVKVEARRTQPSGTQTEVRNYISSKS